MCLNQQQQYAVDAFLKSRNVLITGPAGTGKSYTLRKIIQHANMRNLKIGVTASTGLAAYLIRGRTIHSFMGIGLAKDDAVTLAAKVKNNKMLAKRLCQLQLLIIDEISMIDADLFDKISDVLKYVRKNDTPFGGVQLVLCGDFCQLPPVKGDFCFVSSTWREANIDTVHLIELVRQCGDEVFQRILGKLRWGECDEDTLEVLRSRVKRDVMRDELDLHGVKPTILYSKNVDVDEINSNELKALLKTVNSDSRKLYVTSYTSHPATKPWCASLRIPESFECCVGAQVMVTQNSMTDPYIVNGTRGVVTGVDDDFVHIKLVSGRDVCIEYAKLTHDDDDMIAVRFMPLRLAYAITIHKSQGMTLDAVEMDLGSSIFEYGQAYTALSRARSLQSVCIYDVKPRSFKTHPLVREFYGHI